MATQRRTHSDWQKECSRLDRQLKRRGIVRRPSETLHQFSHRLLQMEPDEAWLERCAAWYLLYAEVRYSPDGAARVQRR